MAKERKAEVAGVLRQGDVALVRLTGAPSLKVAKDPTDGTILAYGETSGHRHEVRGKAFSKLVAGLRWLLAGKAGGTLDHLDPQDNYTGEHGTLAVGQGAYVVVQQSEADIFTGRSRRVYD